MRRVTFTLPERLVLTPIEITQAVKPLLLVLLILFYLIRDRSRFLLFVRPLAQRSYGRRFAYPGSSQWNSVDAGLVALGSFPVFFLEGCHNRFIFRVGADHFLSQSHGCLVVCGFTLVIITLSSYLAMNFTGCTPYTSPSGVEKEMRRAIPWQSAAAVLGLIIWVVWPLSIHSFKRSFLWKHSDTCLVFQHLD